MIADINTWLGPVTPLAFWLNIWTTFMVVLIVALPRR